MCLTDERAAAELGRRIQPLGAQTGRDERRRAAARPRYVAVAINADPALLRRWFSSVRVAAVYRNGLGVSDDEEGAVIWIASGLRSSWAATWPAFRDYS